ncbi:hypothetical protein ACHHV8_15720 [Paenibacillus sp. TAB 01]|uniref:hypothetical protein n=1 Tax=Paenibacillus sp. TAB 01 TaxID=3368988 RepID=UPI003753E2ED
MTSIGLLCVTLITLLLLAFLDMRVYHEVFGSALKRLGFGVNNNMENYLFVAGAFLAALIKDFRGRKSVRQRTKTGATGKRTKL